MSCRNDKKEGCQTPENLKGKPEECSPERIRECHGDVKEHPCLPENDTSQSEEGTERNAARFSLGLTGL
jgi:hypothetical protein